MFVTRKWAPAMGGMETYSHRLTEELAELVNLDVVALRGREDGSPPSVMRLLLFPLAVLRRWFARPRAPEILHLGDMAIWPVGLLAALGFGRTRVVLSAHGTDVSYHRRSGVRGSLYGAYLRLGARLLGRATVIANSHATRDALGETGWRRVAVVPLATDLAAPQATSHSSDRILFAGRLVERKGCAWFINSVLPLLPDSVELEVAGTVWDEAEGSALANPRVRHLGALNRRDLAQAYAAALCVVVPNIPVASGEFEGFGLVAPEVASAGGVLLAARCDGLVDAVIDGKTGILVEPAAPEAWARAIREVRDWTDEQRRAFVEGARTTAQERFSWGRVASETFAHFRALLNEPTSGPSKSSDKRRD